MEIDDQFVMDYGTFLTRYAPVNNLNNKKEMTTVKKWIEITPKQKEILIERLSLLLIWLVKEKKLQAKEIAMRLGFPGSDLSLIKNKKISMISDWKVVLLAVSFGIGIDEPDHYLDIDEALGAIRMNKWDNPFLDHPLASNLYHEEIEYFNSWYGKHEIEATKQFKEDIVNAALAGTRIHEELEQLITEKPSEKTLFDTEMKDPAPAFDMTKNKSVLNKSLVEIIADNATVERTIIQPGTDLSDYRKKASPLFNTIAGAIMDARQFNMAEHMPKETDDLIEQNRIRLIESLNIEKNHLADIIIELKAKIKECDTALQPREIRISAINRMLDLLSEKI